MLTDTEFLKLYLDHCKRFILTQETVAVIGIINSIVKLAKMLKRDLARLDPQAEHIEFKQDLDMLKSNAWLCYQINYPGKSLTDSELIKAGWKRGKGRINYPQKIIRPASDFNKLMFYVDTTFDRFSFIHNNPRYTIRVIPPEKFLDTFKPYKESLTGDLINYWNLMIEKAGIESGIPINPTAAWLPVQGDSNLVDALLYLLKSIDNKTDKSFTTHPTLPLSKIRKICNETTKEASLDALAKAPERIV